MYYLANDNNNIIPRKSSQQKYRLRGILLGTDMKAYVNTEHPVIRKALRQSHDTIAYVVSVAMAMNYFQTTQVTFLDTDLDKKTFDSARQWLVRNNYSSSIHKKKNSLLRSDVIIIIKNQGSEHVTPGETNTPKVTQSVTRKYQGSVTQNVTQSVTQSQKPTNSDILRVAKKHKVDIFRLKHEWEIKLLEYESAPSRYAPEKFMPKLEKLALKLKGVSVTKAKQAVFDEMRFDAWCKHLGLDVESRDIRLNKQYLDEGSEAMYPFKDAEGKIGWTMKKYLKGKHNGKLPYWL